VASPVQAARNKVAYDQRSTINKRQEREEDMRPDTEEQGGGGGGVVVVWEPIAVFPVFWLSGPLTKPVSL